MYVYVYVVNMYVDNVWFALCMVWVPHACVKTYFIATFVDLSAAYDTFNHKNKNKNKNENENENENENLGGVVYAKESGVIGLKSTLCYAFFNMGILIVNCSYLQINIFSQASI